MEDGPGQVDAEEDFGGLMVCFHIDLLALSGNSLSFGPSVYIAGNTEESER
jgi:hypothetical protein